MRDRSYSTSVPGRLLRFQEDGGHPYHGLLFEPSGKTRTRSVVVHSHGTLGNFYFNRFIDAFAESYTSRDVSFLTFNHLAHDGIAESVINGVVEYVGGSVSDFSSCVEDLELVELTLKDMGFQTVIFQGHSLGCERVIHYLETTHAQAPVILLAPVNSRATQEAWCEKRLGMTFERLLEMLKESAPLRLCDDLYGSPSQNPEWDYIIPISEKALLSFLSSDAINYFDPRTSHLNNIEEVLIILPSNDAFSEFSQNSLFDFFSSKVGASSEITVVNCDHDFDGFLNDVCDLCSEWVVSRK